MLIKRVLVLPRAVKRCAMGRYLSDHIAALPLGIIPRLMRTNDVLSVLVPLLSSKPWQRGRGAKLETYAGGQWVACAPGQHLRITQPEAQVTTSFYCTASFAPWIMMRQSLRERATLNTGAVTCMRAVRCGAWGDEGDDMGPLCRFG